MINFRHKLFSTTVSHIFASAATATAAVAGAIRSDVMQRLAKTSSQPVERWMAICADVFNR